MQRLFPFLIVLIFLISCEKSPEIKSIRGETMGTYYVVKVNTEKDIDGLKKEIDQYLIYVNNLFSTYIKDSELSKINQFPINQEIALSMEMNDIFTISKEIHQKSNGAFDITVGPLVNAWGFGPDGVRNRPTDEEVKLLLKSTGMNGLKLNNGILIKKVEGIYIDLSAVAKGNGVDMLSTFLLQKGFKNHLVEIGGEVRARGLKPDKQKWLVGIEKPSEHLGEGIQQVVALENMSMATSGSYRNYKKYGDQIFSHTINPVTGKPVNHKLISVSVMHKDCAYADAWATAFMVLGKDKGLEIANKEDLAVYFLVKNGDKFDIFKSNTFESYMNRVKSRKK